MVEQALNQVAPEWFWTIASSLCRLATSKKMTQEQMEWWIGLTYEEREMLRGNKCDATVSGVKASFCSEFYECQDLGEIVVPPDYKHDICLSRFFDRWIGHGVKHAHEIITDKNYPCPSRVLKPGERLRVKSFRHNSPRQISVDRYLSFLSSQPGIVFPGVQGFVLVFEQKRDKLELGVSYLSLDREGTLPILDEVRRCVPVWQYIYRNKHEFPIYNYSTGVNSIEVVFSFTEVNP